MTELEHDGCLVAERVLEEFDARPRPRIGVGPGARCAMVLRSLSAHPLRWAEPDEITLIATIDVLDPTSAQLIEDRAHAGVFARAKDVLRRHSKAS